MTARQLILSFLSLALILFNGIKTNAQTDYIITLEQDTIMGDMSAWGMLLGRNLSLKTEQGKIKVPKNNIHEYKVNKHTYMFVRIKNKKGRTHVYRCVVLMFGKMRLLEEMTEDGASYFVHFDDSFYRINRSYFSDEVWSILIHCPSFSDKFGSYKAETEHKRFLFFPKQERIWRDMIRHYNLQCAGA